MMRLFLFVEIVSGARVMQEHAESIEADAEIEKASSAQPVVFDQANSALTVTPGALTGTGNLGWSTVANSALQVNAGEGVCGISFKCNTPDSQVLIGLASGTVSSWRDVDFSVSCRGANWFNDVHERGRRRHQMSGRAYNGNPTSDVHAIRVNADGQVEYSLNGDVYYTSSASVSYPWHVAVDALMSPSLSDVEYLRGGCGEPNLVKGELDGTCPVGTYRLSSETCPRTSGHTMSDGTVMSNGLHRVDCRAHFTPGPGCFVNHLGNVYSTGPECSVALTNINPNTRPVCVAGQLVKGGTDGSCPTGTTRVTAQDCPNTNGLTLSDGMALSSRAFRVDCAAHFTPGEGCFVNNLGNVYATGTECASAAARGGIAVHHAVCAEPGMSL